MAWETRSYPLKQFFSKFIVAILAVVVVISGLHSIQIAKKTYSEPTLFLTATGRAGDTFIFDDFRTGVEIILTRNGLYPEIMQINHKWPFD